MPETLPVSIIASQLGIAAWAQKFVGAGGLRDPNALFVADFTRNEYWHKGTRYTSLLDVPGMTFARSGARGAWDDRGRVETFLSGVPRRTARGLKVDNGVSNNATIPAVGTGWATNTADWTFTNDTLPALDGIVGRKLARGAASATSSRNLTAVAMPVVNGDDATAYIGLKASDGYTSCHIGILTPDSIYGLAANATAAIISGPGSIAAYGGSTMQVVSGLSASAYTWIRITRRIVSGDGSTASIFWAGHDVTAPPNVVASAGVVAMPMLTKTPGVVDYVPNTQAATAAAAGRDELILTGVGHHMPITLLADVEIVDKRDLMFLADYHSASGLEQARYYVNADANQIFAQGRAGGATVSQASVSAASITSGGIYRIAHRHTDRATLAATGIVTATGGAGVVPLNLSTLRIGHPYGLTAQALSGFVRRFALIAGPLSDPALNALVTP